jgi:hypothetical protein
MGLAVVEKEEGEFPAPSTRITPRDVASLQREVDSLASYVRQVEDAVKLELSSAGMADTLRWITVRCIELGQMSLGLHVRIGGPNGQ